MTVATNCYALPLLIFSRCCCLTKWVWNFGCSSCGAGVLVALHTCICVPALPVQLTTTGAILRVPVCVRQVGTGWQPGGPARWNKMAVAVRTTTTGSNAMVSLSILRDSQRLSTGTGSFNCSLTKEVSRFTYAGLCFSLSNKQTEFPG